MPSESENKFLPRTPIFEELDLSKSEQWRGKEGVRDYIIERLKKLRLYTPNLIFRGFDGKYIDIVRKDGVYIYDKRKKFYGTRESELASERRVEESALDYALGDADTPAIAVYDGDKLIDSEQDHQLDDYEFKPRKGFSFKEALVAVFILKES